MDITSLTVVFSLSLPLSLWHESGGRAQSFSLMETEKGPEMHSVSVSLFSALTQNPRYQDTSANYGIPMRHSNQNFTEKSSPLSLCVSVSLCLSPSFLMAQKSLLNRQCSVLTRTENRCIKPTKKLPHSFPFFSSFFLSQKSKQPQQAKTSKFSFCSSHKHENKLVIRKHPKKFRKTKS